jgi:hypothetical protein
MGSVEVDAGGWGARSGGMDSPVSDTGVLIRAPLRSAGTSGIPRTVGASPRICSVCHACSNASANSCTVAKRSLGSLASALNTTCSIAGEIVEAFSRKGDGGTAKCWATISVTEP